MTCSGEVFVKDSATLVLVSQKKLMKFGATETVDDACSRRDLLRLGPRSLLAGLAYEGRR